MRRPTAIALGLAFVASFAACSDSESSADITATSTSAAAGSTTAPAALPTDTGATDGSAAPIDNGAPGAGTEFCTIDATLNSAAADAIDEDGTPAALQEFFEIEFPAQFASMTAAAPADLADEMTVLGDGFTALGELFAENEWDLEAAYNDPDLMDVLDNPAYVDAGTAIDAYCGG